MPPSSQGRRAQGPRSPRGVRQRAGLPHCQRGQHRLQAGPAPRGLHRPGPLVQGFDRPFMDLPRLQRDDIVHVGCIAALLAGDLVPMARRRRTPSRSGSSTSTAARSASPSSHATSSSCGGARASPGLLITGKGLHAADGHGRLYEAIKQLCAAREPPSSASAARPDRGGGRGRGAAHRAREEPLETTRTDSAVPRVAGAPVPRPRERPAPRRSLHGPDGRPLRRSAACGGRAEAGHDRRSRARPALELHRVDAEVEEVVLDAVDRRAARGAPGPKGPPPERG